MRLTQRQELLIARYMREVGLALAHVPGTARERAMTRVRARIFEKLEIWVPAQGSLGDDAVLAVLADLGSPAVQAVEFLSKPGATRHLALAGEDRVWLGVCGGLGPFLGIGSRLTRFAFLLLGLTGPLGLVIYLLCYFALYTTTDSEEIPRIGKARLARYVLSTALAAGALGGSTWLVFRLALDGYARWVCKGAPPALGSWGWLDTQAWTMLAVVWILFIPVAALSGLPVPNGWDHTGKRIIQAGLAVYALVLCCGVASGIAGILIHAAKRFSF